MSEGSYHSPRRGSDYEEEERRPMPGEAVSLLCLKQLIQVFQIDFLYLISFICSLITA